MSKSYDELIREEIEQFRNIEEMHALPPVFHDWCQDYVVPGLLAVFGTINPTHVYADAFLRAAAGNPSPAFLSLGCGSGEVEVEVARALLERGLRSFRFVCYDLSEVLLDQFRATLPPDLAPHFELVAEDLNARPMSTRFDAVMANHSLHHMVDLEGIFRTVFDNLAEDGVFVTNDMIGRNGHMRWPEAHLLVDVFWPFLTQAQRRNRLLTRVEERFVNFDCSAEGFEGVRAQDILPALLGAGFHAERFFGFGGLIDVFTDRCFGPNFRMDDPDDAFLARRIGALNEMLLDAGLLTPTMMYATFVKRPVEEIHYRGRSLRRSIRDPGADPSWLDGARAAFDLHPVEPGYVFRAPPTQPTPMPAAPKAPSSLKAFTAQAEIRTALQGIERELAGLRSRLTEKEAQVEAMRASTSWKLTGPLRALARRLRA